MDIIYEDDNILAVNKPAGLPVHGDGKSKEKTFADWLVKNYPGIGNVGDNPEFRPGIVHRLDKDTSGILLVAKNQKAFEFLKKQFQERRIKKEYTALVYGKIKNKKGVIDSPIGRSKRDFRKKSVSEETTGRVREAITEYKVSRIFCDTKTGKFYTLIKAYPKTGRTHQIRVHLKAIGHPVVCDKLYGPKRGEYPFGLNRHFLHASSLELTLPDGVKIKLEAGLPDDLENVLLKLRKLE